MERKLNTQSMAVLYNHLVNEFSRWLIEELGQTSVSTDQTMVLAYRTRVVITRGPDEDHPKLLSSYEDDYGERPTTLN